MPTRSRSLTARPAVRPLCAAIQPCGADRAAGKPCGLSIYVHRSSGKSRTNKNPDGLSAPGRNSPSRISLNIRIRGLSKNNRHGAARLGLRRVALSPQGRDEVQMRSPAAIPGVRAFAPAPGQRAPTQRRTQFRPARSRSKTPQRRPRARRRSCTRRSHG
jgi:hypothetical protein